MEVGVWLRRQNPCPCILLISHLGVVRDGQKFDFYMCNPPFFEAMEETGLNPKTSFAGTPKEMVCPGGEKAFITHIIEDNVVLKESSRCFSSITYVLFIPNSSMYSVLKHWSLCLHFVRRWFTSMLRRKTNIKFLTSKLRDVGVTMVKTIEFV